MIALLMLAGLAQAVDLLTFAPAVARYGTSGEYNPVMAAAYEFGGIWGAAALKGLTLLLMLLAVYAIQGAMTGGTWVAVTILVFAIIAGAMGAASNVWALSL
jgi:hypothetical protein